VAAWWGSGVVGVWWRVAAVINKLKLGFFSAGGRAVAMYAAP
jgi:hypothetical protein